MDPSGPRRGIRAAPRRAHQGDRPEPQARRRQRGVRGSAHRPRPGPLRLRVL